MNYFIQVIVIHDIGDVKNGKGDVCQLHISCLNPVIGEPKKGDLAGIYVYKFKRIRQLLLLAYAILSGDSHITIAWITRELLPQPQALMEQVIHEVKTVEEGHEAHKHAPDSLNKQLELNAVFKKVERIGLTLFHGLPFRSSFIHSTALTFTYSDDQHNYLLPVNFINQAKACTA